MINAVVANWFRLDSTIPVNSNRTTDFPIGGWYRSSAVALRCATGRFVVEAHFVAACSAGAHCLQVHCEGLHSVGPYPAMAPI